MRKNDIEMSDIIYLISSSFCYDKIILHDAGPNYAESMGLHYDTVSNIELYKNRYIIIDNRLLKEDCDMIYEFLNKQPNAQIILKIVDPFGDKETPVHQLLLNLAKHENVRYLSVYSFSGYTQEIYELVGNKRIGHVPYPYEAKKNITSAWNLRKHKIILSGARFKHLYPLRYRLIRWKHRLFTPILWLYSDLLKHPGYPDIGDEKKHDIIGSSYIEYLSKYKFMLVTPTNYDMEVLKYNECAYAGCVPVGIPAESLPQKAKDCFFYLNYKKNLNKQIYHLVNSTIDFEARAVAYRTVMQRERNKRKIQLELIKFLTND